MELCQAELPFGAINELRYAGHHLLRGLAAQESGSAEKAEQEFQDAEDHCNRAMYEASEAGIGYLCRLYRIFEEDYKDLSLTETIPEYVKSRALIQGNREEAVRRKTEPCYFLRTDEPVHGDVLRPVRDNKRAGS